MGLHILQERSIQAVSPLCLRSVRVQAPVSRYLLARSSLFWTVLMEGGGRQKIQNFHGLLEFPLQHHPITKLVTTSHDNVTIHVQHLYHLYQNI